jgi:hypothetical protein
VRDDGGDGNFTRYDSAGALDQPFWGEPVAAGALLADLTSRDTDVLRLITRGNSNTETSLPCAARTPHGTHEGSWSAVRVNSG